MDWWEWSMRSCRVDGNLKDLRMRMEKESQKIREWMDNKKQSEKTKEIPGVSTPSKNDNANTTPSSTISPQKTMNREKSEKVTKIKQKLIEKLKLKEAAKLAKQEEKNKVKLKAKEVEKARAEASRKSFIGSLGLNRNTPATPMSSTRTPLDNIDDIRRRSSSTSGTIKELSLDHSDGIFDESDDFGEGVQSILSTPKRKHEHFELGEAVKRRKSDNFADILNFWNNQTQDQKADGQNVFPGN